MKRISKKQNTEFHRHFQDKKIAFQSTQTVAEEGHFVKPSSQTSFANQTIHIICKGYGNDAVQIANQVLNIFKQSLLTLVDQNSFLNKSSEQIFTKRGIMTEQEKQRYFIMNLIDSCFQELSGENYEGTCSVGVCYVIKNEVFIVKNKMMECYLIIENSKDMFELKNIGSKQLPFQLNTISNNSLSQNSSSKETKGFFSCDKNYENIISKKYFPEISFVSFKIPKKQNLIFLMGNSECFCHFSEEEIINFFREENGLKKGGQELVESSKKKWKTIYQQDMTLIVSKFF